MAASPLGPTAHSGVFPSANNSFAAGILPTSRKTCFEILPVGVVWVLAEEEFVPPFRQLAAVALAGQPAFVDEVVVLHEADEDAGQHPRHGDLIEVVVPPVLERLGGAATLLDLLEGVPQPGIDLGVRRRRASKSSARSVTSAFGVREAAS